MKTIKLPYDEFKEMEETIERQRQALEDYKKAGNVVILDNRMITGIRNIHGQKYLEIPHFRGEMEVVMELDAEYEDLYRRYTAIVREYTERKHSYEEKHRNFDAMVEAEVKRRTKKNWFQKLLGL